MKAERELTELPAGLRRRTLPTARIAARAAWNHVLRLSGRRRPRDPVAALVSAADLVDDLGSFKGLFMKAGQLASFLPAREPDAALALLGRLQDSSVAFAYEAIARVVEEELGAPPEELFERFDRRPIAVASIGQVHRARLDGRELAVKVQFPGIERAFREDLAVLRPLVRLGTFGIPIDGRGLLAELKARIDDECDYRKEAANQRLFATTLAKVPFAKVPEVVPERSGRRVLAMELAEGLDYRRFRATASQAARDRAGETIFRAGMESTFVDCLVNGDPQPGNYLFAADGAVTFLDFGCVRRIDVGRVALWRRFHAAAMEEDVAGAREAFEALGFVGDARRFDWEHEWRVIRHIHAPIVARGPYRVTRRFMEELYAAMFYENPNAMRTSLPMEELMVQRAIYGRLALFADLGSKCDWGAPMRELLARPIAPAWEAPRGGPARGSRKGTARAEATA